MYRGVSVDRWSGVARSADSDFIVVEEPLEVRANDQTIAVTMRTPGQDDALAVGFLVSEGIILEPRDVWDVTLCANADHPDLHNVVTVYVPPDRVPTEEGRSQRYAVSSCGLCGRAAIEAIARAYPPIASRPALSRSMVCALPDRMRAAQAAFERTGGLHGAGLFATSGELIGVQEDIGRHNAVDKVIGAAVLAGRWPLDDTILMVSGRAGFEIVQKALAARVPAVCSVSAPSSLAAELALSAGMILIGFLRGERMNVYSGGAHVAAD